MTQLEIEINQQPQIIAEMIQREAETAAQLAEAIRAFDPAFVVIAARGTSDNAARYAQYLFGAHLGWVVSLAAPSLHTLYDASPNYRRALVIGISQSGQSEDVRRVISDAREQGALTLSITNDPTSPLATGAAHHLPLGAGLERSVAATKTYTSELAALALLTTALTKSTEDRAALEAIPAAMSQTLQMSGEIAGWARQYVDIQSYAVLGRGYNYCTAYEISLKIKELCYIPGEEYSEADFRHGPIAMIEPGFPVIMVAPSGKTFEKQLDLLQSVQGRGAETLVISDEPGAQAYARRWLPIPTVPEWLSPLTAILPGQLLAKEFAAARGYNVDEPRGLTKVTITE
jgi:glutamine---fructose-6-phosphate transaminase (isomerizing)